MTKTAVNDQPFRDWHDVKPQEVTIEDFSARYLAHRDEVYMMPVPARYVGILHGVINLEYHNPAIVTLNLETIMALTSFIEWCNCKFVEWGFTPEQIVWLNNRYFAGVPDEVKP